MHFSNYSPKSLLLFLFFQAENACDAPSRNTVCARGTNSLRLAGARESLLQPPARLQWSLLSFESLALQPMA